MIYIKHEHFFSGCGTTAGAICDPSGIDITRVEEFLKKDENDESESQKIRKSMIEVSFLIY